ncbi:MAG: flagellar hook-basal body complex protein FliE [Candidatus Eremiobacteraeota bacterium]|nr:flagellar hook-basal body complex protein FliE [Candidatus Eremiobacteraeota bacterium]
MKIGDVYKVPFNRHHKTINPNIDAYEFAAPAETKTDRVAFNPVKQVFSRVNESQLRAENSLESFSVGESENIHRVIVDMEEALLNLKFATQVRNKVVDAYQEIMRMQV